MIWIAVVAIGAAAYLLCSLLAFGLTLGYFQRHYYSVRGDDSGVALFMAALGPIGVAITYSMSERGYYGLLFRPISTHDVPDSHERCKRERYPDREQEPSR